MASESILVLNCGGADAVQVARMVRGIGVYCEIVDLTRGGGDGVVDRNPAGVIALGGAQGTCPVPGELLSSGIPVLALGGAALSLLEAAGGERGDAAIADKVVDVLIQGKPPLFHDIEDNMRRVQRAWRVRLPDGFAAYALGEGVPLAFGDGKRRLFGLQFLPERNDVDSYHLLTNFVREICGCDGSWSLETYLESAVGGIRNRAKEGVVVCPMTGGVDTAVCAALAHRALGERALCVLIDTGLMTLGEAEALERDFAEKLRVPVRRIAAGGRFLARLRGVTDPAEKRRVVGEEFSAILREQDEALAGRDVFLVRGTIYDDVLGGVVSILTAGAPERWVPLEPLRGLFKREVRELGGMLGLPESVVARQPFPSAGLAVRCLGEVTPGRIEMLRVADAVFKSSMEEAGASKGLQMYFAALAGVHTLDDGGGRDGETVILRAVQQRDTEHTHPVRISADLLESVTEAVLREAKGVTRVMYDMTPRPPAADEYE